ncbi:hypothetical protein [Escherichia phage ST4]|nr:hypothetical protein [Escherichia phage ST4]
MRFITYLETINSKPQYGSFAQAYHSHWLLTFAEENLSVQPLVSQYEFPAKPTKKQIRKLRREFRKEAI